uniref:Uncharacterized protein n=1 Tax=Rhizophora mucronata TaxID=61149 RepID=A0A2P2QQF8_RHIMU
MATSLCSSVNLGAGVVGSKSKHQNENQKQKQQQQQQCPFSLLSFAIFISFSQKQTFLVSLFSSSQGLFSYRSQYPSSLPKVMASAKREALKVMI